MATELTVQSERAFQKQPHIFLNSKSKTKSTRVGKGGRRWYKDVGLGFRTPKTAIEGNYIGMYILDMLGRKYDGITVLGAVWMAGGLLVLWIQDCAMGAKTGNSRS
jgi:small subunit ribosomal protein S11e